MRKGSLEMQRIVAWVIGIVLALIILAFMIKQFSPEGGGLLNAFLDKLNIFK